MSISVKDADELHFQANELLTLVAALRPTPTARLMSHKMIMLIAVLAENRQLVETVKRADHTALFWEVDGEYVRTRISVEELLVT